MSAAVHGFAAPRFAVVRDAFAHTLNDANSGAALAIVHRGELVVDLWGGIADDRTGRPWAEDTLSVIFSATKGLVAILAARLVQDGLLDYDAPVTDYWPEFGQSGKGGTRVRHLLSHQSGVSAPRKDLTTEELLDWDTVTAALAEQQPLWPAGEGYAYHALTYGWLIGEVIRRVTGTTVGEYFQSLIAQPLGVDAWIGVPADDLHRVAHLQVGKTLAELVRQQAAERDPKQIDWLDRAMTLGGALPPELVGPESGFNAADIRRAEIPGAGGIATARALATIWGATVYPTKGVRLLNDETVAVATAVQTDFPPVFYSPPPYPRWGMGFQLDSGARRYPNDKSFGHDGAGGQVAFADRANDLGFGYITNLMEADDPRATSIIDALGSVLDSGR